MEVSEIKAACREAGVIENAAKSGVCEQICRYYESQSYEFIIGTGGDDVLGDEVEDLTWPPMFVTTCSVMRNLCSSGDNCEYFQERGIFGQLKTVVRRLSMLSSSRLGDDNSKAELKKISNYTVQTVSNVAACGITRISHPLVDHLAGDMIALSLKHQSRLALAASLAALYNSIVNHSNESSSDDRRVSVRSRLETLCSNRPLWCQLLLSFIAGESNGSKENEETKVEDPAREWVGYLMEKVLELGFCSKILALVGPNGEALWDEGGGGTIKAKDAASDSEASHVTYEQIVFLRMMLELWEDGKYLNASSPTSAGKEIWVDGDMQTTLHSLAGLLRSVSGLLTRIDTSVKLELSNEDAVQQASLSYGAVVTLLDALAACLSWQYHQEMQALRDSLENDQGLTKCILSVLSLCARVSDTIFTRFELTPRETSDLQRAALRTLGNNLYRCLAAQEAFRDLDGFVIVLPLCATNLEAPIAREWALLVMRNALEGNPANQDYISALEPQGEPFVQDEELTAAGLSVVLDQATNKFKLRKM